MDLLLFPCHMCILLNRIIFKHSINFMNSNTTWKMEFIIANQQQCSQNFKHFFFCKKMKNIKFSQKYKSFFSKMFVLFCNSKNFPQSERLFVAVYNSQWLADEQCSKMNKQTIVNYELNDWNYYVEEVELNRVIIY
jgi:hypothetical protein